MGCKVGEKIIRWDSTKYTTHQMSLEIYGYLCNKKSRSISYFENEIKKLISNGPPCKNCKSLLGWPSQSDVEKWASK